jgi:hypothetical protein
MDQTARHAQLGPVADAQLAQADGVGEVDVEGGVRVDQGGRHVDRVSRGRVRVRRRPRRVPKVGGQGLKETGARADDVELGKSL